MITIKDDEIYFSKIRPTAIIPSKKDEDAGYDLYADFETDFFVIEAGKTKAIPTGIAVAFSKKYYAQVEERSSMAKIGIKKSGGVMDSGYRGEYLIMTYNTNDKPFIISKLPIDEVADTFEIDGKTYNKEDVVLYPQTKAVCQIVLQIVPKLQEIEISYEELKEIASERSTGGFGSTGK